MIIIKVDGKSQKLKLENSYIDNWSITKLTFHLPRYNIDYSRNETSHLPSYHYKKIKSFFCGPLSNVALAQNIMDGGNDKENRQKTKKNIQIYLTIE